MRSPWVPPPDPPIPPDPELPTTGHGGGGPPMAQTALVQALIVSKEQYAESGTYSQVAVCPDSVDLKRAKKWHLNMNFQLLKQNGN